MSEPTLSEEKTGAAEAAAHRQAAAPKRNRKVRSAVILLLAVLIAAALAPVGLAKYLESRGIRLRGDDGTSFRIEIGQASLGWLSPIRLHDVRVEDSSSEPVLAAERILSTRTLASLVTNRTRPGRFLVDRPDVTVIVRPDGSNLEDLIRVLQSGSKSNTPLRQIGGTMTEGRVSFVDEQGTTLAVIDEISITGERRFDTEQSLNVELTAAVEESGQRRKIDAAVEWTGPQTGLPFLSGAGAAAIRIDPLPLTSIQPLLSRVIPDLTLLSGTVSGELLVDTDFESSQILTAAGRFVSRNVRAVRKPAEAAPSEIRWTEESLAFQLDGQFDAITDSILVTSIGLQSTPVGMTATGTIEDLSGECRIDVSGDLRYDVNPWVQALAGGAGEHVQIAGLNTQRFDIAGPLAEIVDGRPQWDLSRMTVSADVGWETAEVFGVRSEQARVTTKLEDGCLNIEPANVPISGGHFRAAPQITLFEESRQAVLGKGPALENIEFSPEICHLWLKYLSPILADATRVEGRFSIDIEEGLIPLPNAAAGHVSGQLHVHAAEVRPGPFAERMIGIVGRVKSLIDGKPGGIPTDGLVITLNEQRIPFAMTDGRVRHDHMEFSVAGAAVRTSGSVGLNESLDLLVEVPLPESWFRQPFLADTLGGQVIEVPVRGTFKNPQFDLSGIQELARRSALKGVGGLLQKLLDE